MTQLKIHTLWQVSLLLSLLFMGSIGLNFMLAQSHTDYYNRDSVSHAEHEQLKAALEVHDANNEAKLEVLQQRLADDEATIKRNTALVDEHSATINRMEGIGISFGLALTIVQYMLFRAHHESKKKQEDE